MKKLLLSLIIITGSGLLHGMEVPSAVARNALPVFVKTSTDMMTDVTSEEVRTDKQQVDSNIDYSEFSLITLPQMYHQLSKNLLSRNCSNYFITSNFVITQKLGYKVKIL